MLNLYVVIFQFSLCNLQLIARTPHDFEQLRVTIQNTPIFAFIAFSVASISIPMFTNLPIWASIKIIGILYLEQHSPLLLLAFSSLKNSPHTFMILLLLKLIPQGHLQPDYLLYIKYNFHLLRQLNLIFKILIICVHLRPIIKNYSFLLGFSLWKSV